MSNSKQAKIENGIAIPTSRGDSRLPFMKLRVLQSFLVPDDIGNHAAHSSVYYWNHRLKKKKFICRKTAEGTRIWRIK